MKSPALPKLLEKVYQKQIRQLAALMGFDQQYCAWMPMHSPKGWPDLVLGRPEARRRPARLVIAELKTAGGRKGYPSPDQERWLLFLRSVGIEAYCWHADRITDQEIADLLSLDARPNPLPALDLWRGDES